MQELINKVTALGQKGSRIENAALKAAAQPILTAAKGTTLFDDMTGKGRAGLKISVVKTKGDIKYVDIGVSKGDISEIFYLKFLEYGTSKSVARPFLQNAYITQKNAAITILKYEIKKGLGL